MNEDVINIVKNIKSNQKKSDLLVLIKRFDPMIKKMSWRNHFRFHLPFEDYNQEGIMGLINAIKTYDDNVEYNFSHLYQWLYRYAKNYMFRYTIKNNSIVRYVLNQKDRKDFLDGSLNRPLNFEFNDESEDFSVSYKMTPEVKYLNEERNNILKNTIKSLNITAKQREIFNLWMENENYAQTGEILGYSRQYVEQTIKIILGRLKEKLKSFD